MIRTYTIIVIWLTVLSAPLLSMLYRGQLAELGGVNSEKNRIDLSWNSFMSGQSQSELERAFKRASPLWPAFVKTDNQINFSLFNQSTNRYRPKVIKGLDNTLIERAYLRSHNRVRGPTTERLEAKIQELARFQKALNERGQGFLLLISPNKPSVYPESIPTDYLIAGREARLDLYAETIAALTRHKINFLDGREYLLNRAFELKHEIFAKSGTHWSEHAACLVSRELVSNLSLQLGKQLPDVKCTPTTESSIPSYADRDLARLLNIWWPDQTYSPVLEATKSPPEIGGRYRPKILFEGTSFLWAILAWLDHYQVYRERHMYYYFKKDYRSPSGKQVQLPYSGWEQDLLTSDAVIMEINEAFPYQIGHRMMRSVDQLIR